MAKVDHLVGQNHNLHPDQDQPLIMDHQQHNVGLDQAHEHDPDSGENHHYPHNQGPDQADEHDLDSGQNHQYPHNHGPDQPHELDLVSGQNHPYPHNIGPDQPHEHDVDSGQNHPYSLNIGPDQPHEHDVDSGQNHPYPHNIGPDQPHEHDVDSGQNHPYSHNIGPDQPHEHDVDSGQNHPYSHNIGPDQPHEHDVDSGQNHLYTHNLVPGQAREHDLDFGQNLNDDLALDHSHEQEMGVELPHDHEENGEHPYDLDLGQNHNDELALGHSHEQDLGIEQAHDHEENGEHPYELGADVGVDEKPGHDHENHQMSISISSQNNELCLIECNQLAVTDDHELGENVELTLEQSQEMGIVSAHDMELQQPEFVLSTPTVLQARTVAVIPSHELHVGQEFPDVQSCRRALRDCAIALRFEIQTIKSDKTRFTAKCATEGCPWRIHAAKLPGVPTFTIRTLQENHTCIGLGHLGHQQASVQWVANSVEQWLKENPEYKPKEILEEIHRTHGITLSYKQAWRGKERIMASMRGSFQEGYRLLPQYCEQVKRTNPGSIASVYGYPVDNRFQRLFISFQASIYGFLNGCRPLLGIDRAPLKSKYLGALLLATGFDGDGALYPLAFGVVDEENDDNWMWFLSELHCLLEVNTENMPRLTILSDRQKGIVDGVEVNFPTAFHGFCMRHLSENFLKEFNNTMLVNLLWEAAHALTGIEFEAKILEIEEISRDAAYWIRRIPPRLWATAYFEGTRFGHLTANIVETLDYWLHEASGLPIIQMMESVRRQLMTWFNERRETSMQWTSILVPNAERRVAEAIELARAYEVQRANEAEFEVRSHEGTHVVDIRNRCCLCRGWQLYGLPCAHAVAALLSCRQNVHRFTESCFTVATYRKSYSQTIHPIPDKSMWRELTDRKEVTDKLMWKEVTDRDGDPNNQNQIVQITDRDGDPNNQIVQVVDVVINPPRSPRPPGKPRKKRARTEDQGKAKRVVHCSRCNQTGHFRTTCAAPV